MELSLTHPPEAPQMKFDWKLPVFLIVVQCVAIAVQWGVMSDRIEAEMRRQDQQDRHMEFIDEELRQRGTEAGAVAEFRQETQRRFDAIDKKLDYLESKHQ